MKDWQPASGPGPAARRAAMKRRIRAYFEARHVLEVDTPMLSPYAVSDPQIESFEITQSQVSATPLYLHTSPEYYMKRLLAAEYPDIYSLCRVFRDGESGRLHQPELQHHDRGDGSETPYRYRSFRVTGTEEFFDDESGLSVTVISESEERVPFVLTQL